ncbi:MAG: MaoC family dehydratase [Phycisphaerales bacterium]|nr:MaoC family dehydratase [Phycisphaerales bacterium]
MEHYIGRKALFSKTIAEFDVYSFAGITGDLNKMHVDEEYAKTTRFGKRIAHGMLTASYICTALGTKLPGEGTIHIKQELEFLKPVYIGDTITVHLEVMEVLPPKSYLKITSQIFNQNQELVVDGFSIVKVPKEDYEI